MTLARVRAELDAAGLNLTATLAADAYDAHVPDVWSTERVRPGCRSVLLVGNAGRALWTRLARAPECSDPEHPVDRYTLRMLEQATHRFEPPASFAVYWEQREGAFLPLITLARAAGLGAPSRLGLLIHPHYGPWISLRAVLYLDEAPATEPAPRPLESPCSDCPAPCIAACHGSAVSTDGLDPKRCLATKLSEPACARGCDARVACVVGREHAFVPDQLAHHTRMRGETGRWPVDFELRSAPVDRAFKP